MTCLTALTFNLDFALYTKGVNNKKGVGEWVDKLAIYKRKERNRWWRMYVGSRERLYNERRGDGSHPVGEWV